VNVVRMPVPGPLAINLAYPVTCPHWLLIDISLANLNIRP
jgi:hypothetical protein